MTSSFAGRILVVDDHDLNLKLLQRVLELDGHRVTAVSTLSAAERAIAHEIPELIVLDLNLPDGDGLGLARKLKSDPRTCRMRDPRLHRRRHEGRSRPGARGRLRRLRVQADRHAGVRLPCRVAGRGGHRLTAQTPR